MTGRQHKHSVRPYESPDDPDGIECRQCGEPFDLDARDLDECPNCGYGPADVRPFPATEAIIVVLALIALPFVLLMVVGFL